MPNCYTTIHFLKEYARMCKVYHVDCDECPLSCVNNGTNKPCQSFMQLEPELAAKIVQEWSDGRPPRTRLDDIKEKYPRVCFNVYNTPHFRPCDVGYCDKCEQCPKYHDAWYLCWLQPLDGGATGKEITQ